MLVNSPSVEEVADDLTEVLKGKEWTAFNMDFDSAAIRRTFGSTPLKAMSNTCAMDISAKALGSTNRYGTISLNDAIIRANVQRTGNAHDAVSDALATVHVIRAISELL